MHDSLGDSLIGSTRMTLGNVYDMDLKKNEALIKEVIIQAQGEVCLSASEIWVASTDPFV